MHELARLYDLPNLNGSILLTVGASVGERVGVRVGESVGESYVAIGQRDV